MYGNDIWIVSCYNSNKTIQTAIQLEVYLTMQSSSGLLHGKHVYHFINELRVHLIEAE